MGLPEHKLVLKANCSVRVKTKTIAKALSVAKHKAKVHTAATMAKARPTANSRANPKALQAANHRVEPVSNSKAEPVSNSKQVPAVRNKLRPRLRPRLQVNEEVEQPLRR